MLHKRFLNLILTCSLLEQMLNVKNTFPNDPHSVAVDAFTISWKDHFFYAFPPFALIFKVLQKIEHDNCMGIVIVPDWSTQPWYPIFQSLLISDPLYLDANIYGDSLLEANYPGSRDIVRMSCVKRGIPVESHNIILQSLSSSTWKQYDTEYDRGASYGNLNSYRSALSLIMGSWLAKDENLKRFFKGLSRMRPNMPKYDCTWDPKIVIDFYKKKANTPEMSLKDLSHKLIILLALITGHRLQTFSLISIDNIRETEDYIEIKIDKSIKTTKSGRSHPVLTIPFYKEDPKVCVASVLKQYLHGTHKLRNDIKELFISFKRPHLVIFIHSLRKNFNLPANLLTCFNGVASTSSCSACSLWSCSADSSCWMNWSAAAFWPRSL
uniref:Tyr recombinase domain-containing protein n=1 Tax=Phlebotomus papatasi TaxID=29031 RepID=A0A1B0GPT1_PHLPP